MGGLGELLELLHGAGTRWSTVRLSLRRWSDDELTWRAMNRAADHGRARGATVVVSRRGHGEPGTWESTARAWVDRVGDRRRTETDGPHGDHLTVRVGPTWWSYSEAMGAMSNEQEPEVGGGGGSEFDWMLEPSALLPAFDFTVTGPGEVAGRATIEALAVPRSDDPRLGYATHLARGADELKLAVDAERGVLLRSEGRIDGRSFTVHEVTEVAFDEAFADEVFRFAAPDGSPVRSPWETFPKPEPVSIEEAARRASFTVLVPTRLPDGWSVDVTYSRASIRPRHGDSVTLHVLGDRRSAARVWIHQHPQPIDDNLAWEAVDHAAMRVLLFRHAGPMGTWDAKALIEGTHVRASSNVDREALLEIVTGLRPAPTELPPFP